MFRRHENIEPQEEAIVMARALHKRLEDYGVWADEVPVAISKLSALYHAAIKYDHDHFNKSDMVTDDGRVMMTVMNKFARYSIDGSDIEVLEKLNFEEARHIQDFWRFELQAIAYAKFVREHLLQLKSRLDELAANKEVTHNGSSIFHRHDEARDNLKKLGKLLKNINDPAPSMSTCETYLQVCDIFHNTDLAKCKSPTITLFYKLELQKLKAISFIPSASAVEKDKSEILIDEEDGSKMKALM